MSRWPRRTLQQRFLSFVEKTPTCWAWKGKTLPKINKPYPYIKIATGKNGGRSVQAYRVAYEIYKGPIPKGLHIDHTCSNMRCVNPEHLQAVTCAQNNRLTILRGRFRAPNH